MTDPDGTIHPFSTSIRSLLTRRRLLLTAASGAFGLGLTDAASGHDDDPHDTDHDDDDRRGRDDDDDDDRRYRRDDGVVRPSGTIPPGSAEVVIDDDDADGFEPGTITIDVGQSVTWINLDDDPHTATGIDFDTGTMQPGDLATVTFDEPGLYPYSCQLHPVMTGIVEVRDASGEVPEGSREQSTPDASPAASPESAAGSGTRAEVNIDNLAFEPADLRVPTGTTVVWTNREAIPHTATARDNGFDSGILEQGDVFEHTFDEPGVFDYICELHPSMEGRVTVE